ncbi:MAG: M20/M25/M40 family metallo-hydrolase [Candidatus Magasanikbacteria bacterium]|nr:M20/M25/M40 family metallo-hydrolase [Candidatus Magasanikbacteria bacterium]
MTQTNSERVARIKKTFLELIAIDGIFPYEAAVIEYVRERLSTKNVPVIADDFGNLIIKIPGRGDAVLLSTHLDIPEPQPNVKFIEDGDWITSDGSGILGADPKTGLAILIEFAIDRFAEVAAGIYAGAPLDIVLTRGEETGLLGARALDYSLIDAKIGLVLDEDGPVTQVVIQAPSFVKIDAKFIGKVVHPREPELGINALQAAVTALASLPWGYSTPGVTWNVGMFSSGTARNSVPGECTFAAELRSYDAALVRGENERVRLACEAAAKSVGAQLEYSGEFEFEGYSLNRAHPLFQRLEKTFASLGNAVGAPNYFATFGGSDANIFNAHGIQTVPLGSGYYRAHEYTEAANVGDMDLIYEFLERFVK